MPADFKLIRSDNAPAPGIRLHDTVFVWEKDAVVGGMYSFRKDNYVVQGVCIKADKEQATLVINSQIYWPKKKTL